MQSRPPPFLDHDNDDFWTFCETDENIGALTSQLITPAEFVLQFESGNPQGGKPGFVGAERPYRLEMSCDTSAPTATPTPAPTPPPTVAVPDLGDDMDAVCPGGWHYGTPGDIAEGWQSGGQSSGCWSYLEEEYPDLNCFGREFPTLMSEQECAEAAGAVIASAWMFATVGDMPHLNGGAPGRCHYTMETMHPSQPPRRHGGVQDVNPNPTDNNYTAYCFLDRSPVDFGCYVNSLCPGGYRVGYPLLPSGNTPPGSVTGTIEECAAAAVADGATMWLHQVHSLVNWYNMGTGLASRGNTYCTWTTAPFDGSNASMIRTDEGPISNDDRDVYCDLQTDPQPPIADPPPVTGCPTGAPTAAPTTAAPTPACVCAGSWTSDDGGTCNETQFGCPSEACDTMDGDYSWCIVQNAPCATAEDVSSHTNGTAGPPQAWSYCTRVPMAFSDEANALCNAGN